MRKLLPIFLLCTAFIIMATFSYANVDKEKEMIAAAENSAKAGQIVRTSMSTDDIGVIPYDWVEINPAHPGALPGTNSGITLDDQNVGPFPIGFEFPWYDGATHNTIRLCSNGFASFTSTTTSYTNYAIPTAAEPNNLVAPYWDDMNVSGSNYGSIWYYADPGGDFFVAEWDSCAHYGSSITGEWFTFELILYPDGTIDFMYRVIEEGTMSPFPSATVGVENSTGTEGIQGTYNGSGPYEPDDQMGLRIDPVGGPPPLPDLELTLIPFLQNIQIPASGGSFEFYLFITNNETSSEPVEVWIEYVDPMGFTSDPLMGPATGNLPPGTRGWYRAQNIPGTAMAGEYLYVANLGMYPDTVWFSDSFPFEKLATGHDSWVGNWNNWGDPFGDELLANQDLTPDEFALIGAYPNPFNPATTIRYTLANADRVKLSVYDLSGCEVAILVDGYRDAGSHEVNFDASGLASGVYVYRLSSGQQIASGKMVLMK